MIEHAGNLYDGADELGAEAVPIAYHSGPRREPWVAPLATSDVTLEAIVNDNRWLVQCPDDTCNSASHVNPSDPRFFCVECGDRAIKGKWYKVKFPKNRAAIEEVLDVRPFKNRNWRPHETLADLKRENKENGVG